MRIKVIIFFLLIHGSSWAQEEVEVSMAPTPNYEATRALYITTFPEYFFLYPVLKQRKLNFEMQSVNGKKSSLTYNSNKPYSFGVGLYLFEIGFELAFAVPLDEQNRKRYGESDASDIQLNVLGKKWGVDAFYQKYSGFYIDNPDENIVADRPYPQRPDIETRNIGLTTSYIFNNQKFSFRSAYNFAERQIKSAGSFLLFGSLSSFKAVGDSAIIGDQYTEAFGDDAQIYKIKTTILGIAPGYTYNLIYKGFFLNGTLAIGPAHNWLSSEVEDGDVKNDINFSAFVAARLAIGYNGDRFFGGLSFVNQGRNAKFENVELTSSNSTFKILFGYRFEEFGVLKKRVWDIPKLLME